MRDSAEFWASVRRDPGPDACHEWTGAANAPGGPGIVYVRRGRPGEAKVKRWVAHRLAWWLLRGTKPPPVVEQTCGNGLCCRNEHLRASTPAERGQRRGRQLGGIPDATAVNILRLGAFGMGINEIRLGTGASERTIRTVLSRRPPTLDLDLSTVGLPGWGKILSADPARPGPVSPTANNPMTTAGSVERDVTLIEDARGRC